MKLVKIGANTKNAEGIKISGEIRKTFEKYLKAKQKDKDESTNYDSVTIEQLYASWLATFAESEDYKETIEAYNNKKNEAKKSRDSKLEEKRNTFRKLYAAQGFEGEQLEKIIEIAVQPGKKGRKKASEKATEQE